MDLSCLLLGLSWHVTANATAYYVSSSAGSDVNAGTSPEAPWHTISKLNRTRFSTGDRIYFLAGDEWDDEFLTVNWSGTAANHGVIGAYHFDSDGMVAYGAGPGNLRPVINDHYRWGWEMFTAATGSNPGIDVSGSYVDIEDVEVRQSGWGIRIEGGAQTNVTVTNVFINGAYQCGILAHGVTNLTIQRSELFNAEAFRGLFGQYGNWCSTIGIESSHDILVQNNYIHDSWGEGINAFYGSTNAVIRDNVLYANWAVGIYMGALNGADIHGNLVLGTADRRFWRTPLSVGPGIAMDSEAYEFVGGPTTSRGAFTGKGALCPLGAYGNYAGKESALCPDALQNIRIYDNLVAGTSAGLAAWFADYPAAYTNVRVYNNTFVDNEAQMSLGGQIAYDYIVANNIFLSLTAGMVDVSGSNYGMTFDTNYWSRGRPQTVGSTPLSSSTDIIGGAEIAQMTGWRNIIDGHRPEARSFAPNSRSSTLGKGTEGGLFFDRDFFGDPLRHPVDLGAIAGSEQASPVPTPSPAGAGGAVAPNPATPGRTITVTGSFTTSASAENAILYFWLAPPDGHYVAKSALVANFRAGVPTPVATTMTLPSSAAAGNYVVSAGAYSGATAIAPYVGDFASVRVR